MFNILVSGNGTVWETDQLMRFTVSRFKEYSEGPEAAAISVTEPDTLQRLEQTPALLMYERFTDAPNADVVRYGHIRDVRTSNKELVFRFSEIGRVDRSVVVEFADRLGMNAFQQAHTHWAIKDGGIPTAILERLRLDAPLISSGTRGAFEDSYVRFGVLRDISRDFDEAGIEPKDLELTDVFVGQRRQLLHRYYRSIDWSSVADSRRVIQAYASHLQRLQDRNDVDEQQRLMKHLKRDRARCPLPSLFDPVTRKVGAVPEDAFKTLEEAASAVATSFDQALEHLNQALEHLRAPQTSRSRKDGLRDCLSAMESLLKTATGTSDIKDATNALKADARWGTGAVVKDGLTIWNRIHELYPDVRHGQATSSDLGERECMYWVDRITTFVRYLARTADDVLQS